jgi:redox-sensitive bicupin YhaK (pirin superfamily)
VPVHFVQMWIVPDQPGISPEYQQHPVEITGGWVTVASGMADDAAVTIHNRNAALHVARLAAGANVELPQAPYLHLFVARGDVTLEEAGALSEGDAVRFTASGGQRATATTPSEILVWEMHAALAA